jgi:hypothetical protein
MRTFSEEQNKKIEDLVEWVCLLREEPEFTNRLKIWKRLKDDGADGCLILEAFRRTGLLQG